MPSEHTQEIGFAKGAATSIILSAGGSTTWYQTGVNGGTATATTYMLNATGLTALGTFATIYLNWATASLCFVTVI